MVQSRSFVFLYFLIAVLILSCRTANRIDFKPAKGEHIVFIGNTFAERLQYYNYFEPLLYQSFPQLDLSVRNMGWSADEVNLQPRPLNFGTLDEHLAQQKAGTIFACFGLNEAFDGPDSLQVFKENLTDFLQHLSTQKYNGSNVAKVILVSPIAHEKLGAYLPDPASHNKNLELYTRAMKDVAARLDIPFIDLYEPTAERMKSGSDSLTINGIHLNDKGYRLVSEIMAKVLNFKVASWTASKSRAGLKSAIDQKNLHFFYKFRAVNGEYIYGRRKEPWVQPPGSILSYPTEMKEIDGIVGKLDTIIWRGLNNPVGIDMAMLNKTVSYSTQSEPKSVIPASTEQFTLRDGYEINLFASELDFPIEKPVKLAFDPRGRMWVSTMPSYPQYYPGSPPNDKIVILEDSNKDGRADKHTVFADSLYMPLGFELGNNGVFVTQAPNLLFLKDNNGDDHADESEIILHGFGTEDVHHSISAHTWGPDGALYMHMGTFLHSQVETPYGPVRGAYGETYRYEPRTMKLQPYISYPYANPWGNVFTRNGTHLIGDVSTGMNYFAPPLTVATDYPKKHVEMKDFLSLKVRPKTCGIEVVSSRQFPGNVQGDVLFNTFIGFQGIKQHAVREQGSGIVAREKEPLLQSKDPRFRPVDLQFGPDGALYVVDWFNAIINHGERALRDPGRDHSHGRIWRITYKNKKPLAAIDLSRLGISELLNQLTVYEDRVRYRTRIQLSNYAAAEVLPEVSKWIDRLDTHDASYEQNKLEALWVHQQFNTANEKLLDELLKAADHNVRAAATRVLFYWRDRIKKAQERLSNMSADSSARVRLEAIAALSHFNNEAAVKTLLAATEFPVD
ncbi:MAG TPA: PVC-type heme-binding CxxCH protein, partial [Chitinophagaceae bacterium]|nr:PVC-type heme-binding CxxCH protein [Chitinophagaceae bacterium]